MRSKDIMARLERLEKICKATLPLVLAEYADGNQSTFYGLPPTEDILREDNPIVRTSGSEFAELLNAVINPVPNRNIEDYE